MTGYQCVVTHRLPGKPSLTVPEILLYRFVAAREIWSISPLALHVDACVLREKKA